MSPHSPVSRGRLPSGNGGHLAGAVAAAPAAALAADVVCLTSATQIEEEEEKGCSRRSPKLRRSALDAWKCNAAKMALPSFSVKVKWMEAKRVSDSVGR